MFQRLVSTLSIKKIGAKCRALPYPPPGLLTRSKIPWFTMTYRPSSAGMVESADTADLKSADPLKGRGGSSPPPGTIASRAHRFASDNHQLYSTGSTTTGQSTQDSSP